MLQSVADHLQQMQKFADEQDYFFPPPGGRLSIELYSVDSSEQFLLDISRGSFGLKRTFQDRSRGTIILARLDINGPPHTNPDGEFIGRIHLHTYREGYGDKWAKDLPCIGFENVDDVEALYRDFLSFCSIVRPPKFIGALT